MHMYVDLEYITFYEGEKVLEFNYEDRSNSVYVKALNDKIKASFGSNVVDTRVDPLNGCFSLVLKKDSYTFDEILKIVDRTVVKDILEVNKIMSKHGPLTLAKRIELLCETKARVCGFKPI